MTSIPTMIALLFSVLMPSKQWYAPGEPLLIRVDTQQLVSLIATDFAGKVLEPAEPTLVEPGSQVDIRRLYPAMRVGTYILYAVPEGRTPAEFIGTPLVLQFRGDGRPGAPVGTISVKVEPLSVARFDTSEGSMTLAFYYDVAPDTVANFVQLSREGFYDGLTFHRIVPSFVIQGGCPLGNSQGGPGYRIEAEFNDRPHLEGVISMAREGDPLERGGTMPRPEYANSASSQFFLCLDYTRTRNLDRKYAAFGRLVGGFDTLRKLGAVAIADEASGRPTTPPVIRSIRIEPVTPGENPYPQLLTAAAGTE